MKVFPNRKPTKANYIFIVLFVIYMAYKAFYTDKPALSVATYRSYFETPFANVHQLKAFIYYNPSDPLETWQNKIQEQSIQNIEVFCNNNGFDLRSTTTINYDNSPATKDSPNPSNYTATIESVFEFTCKNMF